MVVGFVVAALFTGVFTASVTAQVEVKEHKLEWITPGTVIGEKTATGWSHLVFAAYPRIGAGDVDGVGTTVRNVAKKFTIVCAANVVGAGEAGKAPFHLDDLRIGLATLIHGKHTIISSDDQRGANLGLIEGQVLKQTEKDFETGIVQVARTPNMCVFDSKAILVIDDNPLDMFMRYAVLTHKDSGKLATLSWLFDDRYQLHNAPMQYVPAGFNEDRVLSVDADKFFLGIPQKGAIAQVKMGGESPIPFTTALKVLAAKRRFKADEAQQLEAELWKLWGPPRAK